MVAMNDVGVNLACLKKSRTSASELREERKEMRSEKHNGVAKSSCTF